MRLDRHKISLRALVFVVGYACCCSLFAGLCGAEEPAATIREIRIHSQIPFPPERLTELTRLNADEPFSWEGLHQGFKRLYETGLFQDILATVGFTAGGVTLDYTLIEKRVIRTVDYAGEILLPMATLRSATGLKEGDEFVPGKWEEALDRVRRLYQREGYVSAQVHGMSLFPEPGGVADLRIEIDPGAPERVRNLFFEGRTELQQSVLTSQMTLSPGRILSLNVLDSDLARIREIYAREGYLTASVGPPIVRPAGERLADLIVPVESGPVVEVRFEGKMRFPEKELRAQLPFIELKTLDEPILAESARRLERFFREKSYLKAGVRFRKESFSDLNKVGVFFLLNSGPRFVLGAIRFSGNEHFSGKRLLGLLKTRESGLFQRAKFSEEIAKENVGTLANFYKRNGFLHPNISSKTILDDRRGEIILVFEIEEGTQTFVESIAFVGGPALSRSVLQGAIRSKPGTPFDELTLGEDRSALETAYGRAGYILAKIDPVTEFSEGGAAARVVFKIEEGERFFVGRIGLTGNDFTRGGVIRRELLIKPGDPYDPEKILQSKQRLYRLGFFSDVQIEPLHPPAEETTREMELRVRERPGGTVSFGVGYGDFEGLRGSIEAGHKNIFGTGREIHGTVEGSRLIRRLSVDYKEPWMFNRSDLNGRAGAIYQTRTEPVFSFDKLGTFVGLDRSFSDKLKGALVYEAEWDRIDDLQPGVQLSTDDSGDLRLATLNPSLVWDTRDNPLEPTGGFINGFTLRTGVKGLGSEVGFNKLNIQSSWFVSVTDKVVFALSARGGVARRFGSGVPIPITERFFLGGQGTLRGYSQDRVGVTGQTLVNGIPTGGDGMILFNEEIRLPLPYSFGLVLFFDHGNVWREVGGIRADQIKTSIGTGLRYRTPVGPIRLDFGYKLNREPGEEPWRIHFTLGEIF